MPSLSIFSRKPFSQMKLVFSLSMMVLLATTGPKVKAQDSSELLGRWDISVEGKTGDYPSWLEVRKSGHKTLVGSFVGQFGSARPISEIRFDGEEMRFQIPPQWENRDRDLVFEGTHAEGKLSWVATDSAGGLLKWTAVRAPALKRKGSPVWGEPTPLFNGKNVSGWRSRFEDRPHGWEVVDGLLSNVRPGVDLVTTDKFEDFKLNVEFRYPEGSNSGIYLRGRYEVQIEDNFGDDPDSHKIGGVYGFLTPSLNAAKPAGEWQTKEITLVGRALTLVFNGERVLDRQSIPGITGGALDNLEGQPGPLMIQGDHGPVEFRKIAIALPKE